MFETLCCVMMTAITLWCVASLVLLVKIWPMIKWSVDTMRAYKPIMDKMMNESAELLNEEETK